MWSFDILQFLISRMNNCYQYWISHCLFFTIDIKILIPHFSCLCSWIYVACFLNKDIAWQHVFNMWNTYQTRDTKCSKIMPKCEAYIPQILSSHRRLCWTIKFIRRVQLTSHSILWYSDWLNNTTSAGSSIFVANRNTSSVVSSIM